MRNENILARLTMEIRGEKINVYKAANMQGMMFEHINSEYADILHQQGYHPYSQYVRQEDDKLYWIVQTTDNEAYENVLVPLLAPGFQGFELCKGEIHADILARSMTSVSYGDLMTEYKEKDAQRDFELHFLTPTAFRQKGRYQLLPEPRLIFQSIMMRYSAIPQNMDIMDEDTLEQLAENTYITRYQLRTVTLPAEGQSIPGFVGRLSIRTSGTEIMARYLRLLLRFAEYSGIGIKTGMGMGAVRIGGWD